MGAIFRNCGQTRFDTRRQQQLFHQQPTRAPTRCSRCFLGTGLGPRAYAIIGQGTISRIIESRPEELRLFLEEAAGVSKYKERRRETENRLSDTRENLTRVDDILRELNANLEKLEKQAEVAQRFNDLKADSALKQQQLWFFKRADAETDQVKIKVDVDKAVIDLEARIADLRHVEADLETVRQAHYAAGDQVNQAQGMLYEASAEVSKLEAEIRFVVEGRQRAEQRLLQLQTQSTEWSEKQIQALTELEALAEQALKPKIKPSHWLHKSKIKPKPCLIWKKACDKRKPKPTSKEAVWCRFNSKFRCWRPISATSKTKPVNSQSGKSV